MKSKEEIKLMGESYATTHEDVSDRLGKYLVSACFQDGYTQCQEDMADKKYTEKDSRIVKIYNKRLKKYWECSYGAFLKRWGNNGWAIVNK